MARFLIEVPHEAEKVACARAVQVLLKTGSHFLTHADWGCKDGEHKAWLAVDVDSKDEARHGGAYLRYMKRAVEREGDVARAAFARVGVLMASAGRGGKPLHPTNLHVNKALFPRDTVQSRLPDPGWLDRWLDQQIRFDRDCEQRVVRAILRSLSALFGEPFETVRDLNRYRKALAGGGEPRPRAPEGEAPAAGA